MVNNVQALRALAAYMVVVFHLHVLIVAAGLPSFGNGGVDVFFVVSGFIMVHTTRTASTTPGGFILNRLTRVAPLYWTMTFVVFGIALVAPSLFKNTSADPVELLMSLLFIPFQKAAVGAPQPILFVGWTLNYEMFFYALFALGLFAPTRWKGALAVVAVLVALVAAGLYFQPKALLPGYYMQSIVLEFGAGMLLGLGLPLTPEKGAPAARWGALAVAAGAIFMLMLNQDLGPAMRTAYYGSWATVLVGASLLLERWGWAINSRPLLLIGNASYSVYLTHIFVTIPAERFGKQLGATGWLPGLMALAALTGVTLLGIAVHLWVEKPVTGLARRLLASRVPVPGLHRQPPA